MYVAQALRKLSKSVGAMYCKWPCFHIVLWKKLQIFRVNGRAIAPPAPYAPPALQLVSNIFFPLLYKNNENTHTSEEEIHEIDLSEYIDKIEYFTKEEFKCIERVIVSVAGKVIHEDFNSVVFVLFGNYREEKKIV